MLYEREGYPDENEFVLCTVTKIQEHGVFVNIDEYDEGGLVHISEVAPGRIRNIKEYVELGRKTVCKVLKVNKEKGHIDLSLRRVSDMQKKEKMDEIKSEQKAERIIKDIANELDREVEEVYTEITENVFEEYPYVYKFFYDLAKDEISISDFIDDEEISELVKEKASERFKPSKVEIEGEFNIKSYESDGVGLIKDTIQKVISDEDITFTYEGGGQYTIRVKAEKYPEAEDKLSNAEEIIREELEGTESSVKFNREE